MGNCHPAQSRKTRRQPGRRKRGARRAPRRVERTRLCAETGGDSDIARYRLSAHRGADPAYRTGAATGLSGSFPDADTGDTARGLENVLRGPARRLGGPARGGARLGYGVERAAAPASVTPRHLNMAQLIAALS